MDNAIFRQTVKEKGIRLWEIATKIGVSEATMTRWLRTPLSPEREKTLYDALNSIISERSVQNG